MNIQKIKQQATPILKKHGILHAAVFGSAARGEMNKKSDIDFLVDLPNNVHGFDYVDLKISLQEELESVLGKPVDIVEYKLIKSDLKPYILPTQIQII